MSYEPRLITPFKNGLVKYYKPWLIAEDAFPSLFNAYAWRGSVRKREGYNFFGNLPGGDAPVQGLKNWIDPANLTKTLVAYSRLKSYIWNATLMLPVFQDITFLADPPGQAFSWSNMDTDYFYTSNYAASMWSTNNIPADHIRYWTGVTGSLNINGGWSIHTPTVNGLTQLDTALLILPYKGRLVTLNTIEGGVNFSSRARWSQIGTPYSSNSTPLAITGITPGSPTVVFVSNTFSFVVGEPAGIVGIVGSIGSVLNFNQFNVLAINPNTSITIDVDTTGLTWTSGGLVQGPGTTVPPPNFEISIFAWRDDIAGRGGYIDADTNERIISADIVKDTLIVFFQRSTWRLRYTGNEILPFIWERLNTQYGAEATFSNVPFDDVILAFSRFGWIASDTNNVRRIDENIPDDCFTVDNSEEGIDGLARIQGLRDFYRQMAYWTFPSLNPGIEPNEIYAYNYIDKNWAIFQTTNSIRCFGEYSQSVNQSWQNLSATDDRWRDYSEANDIWSQYGSSQSAGFPIILGGDVLGNVFEMFDYGVDVSTTDDDATFNFEITTKKFNPYIEKGMKCRLGYVDLYISTLVGGEITFQHFVNDQTYPVFERIIELYPRGIAQIAAILRGSPTTFRTATPHELIDQQQVLITDMTGDLAPFINNINFTATVIDAVRFTIDFDSTGSTFGFRGVVNNPILVNYGTTTYTRVFLGAIAHMHQFVITLSDEQLADPSKGAPQFELQGMVIWSRPAGMIRG